MNHPVLSVDQANDLFTLVILLHHYKIIKKIYMFSIFFIFLQKNKLKWMGLEDKSNCVTLNSPIKWSGWHQKFLHE